MNRTEQNRESLESLKQTVVTLATIRQTAGLDYETEYEYGVQVEKLASAMVYGCLNKLIEKTADESMIATKHETVYEMEKREQSRQGRTLTRRQGKLYLGFADDLISVATLALLENMTTAFEQYGKIDLDEKHEQRVLNRRVYIKDEQNDDCYKTVEKCILQNVNTSIRQYIDSNSNGIVSSQKYSYLEDSLTDENGEKYEIYRRMPKYYDLGKAVVDYNEQEIAYTVSQTDYEDYKSIDELIASLGLTDRQKEVLHKRLQGYGHKAIARALRVSRTAIQKTAKQIEEKAKAVLKPDFTLMK